MITFTIVVEEIPLQGLSILAEPILQKPITPLEDGVARMLQAVVTEALESFQEADAKTGGRGDSVATTLGSESESAMRQIINARVESLVQLREEASKKSAEYARLKAEAERQEANS
jgi:hypothetical protein